MSHNDSRYASLVCIISCLIFLFIMFELMGTAILSNPGLTQLLRVLGGAQ